MGGVKAEELLAIASSEFNGKNLSNYFEDARLTVSIVFIINNNMSSVFISIYLSLLNIPRYSCCI